ncbi:phosphorylase family protein [Dictyobacter arantiisoli]|uniref:Nucleoside phosphorylase domain-containing protein n=1 Tax=Dictyobacter arantiisoli TaxID=2014874 RepID=A0A5A5TBP5_9CHLR|nr:hypothetical protein [Dictyobacter arantiisoli]GCF08429.1 hypothetical protein KDI_19930 [Dictyobacter arantiisoli]
MEPPYQLTELAQIMVQRLQESPPRPYNLLLSSTLSLTPGMLQRIAHTPNWHGFCQYLRHRGYPDRLIALKPLAEEQDQQQAIGYRALARLIIQGYFRTILTTNLDSRLEHALEELLIEEGKDPYTIQTLIVDRHNDGYIAQQLDEPLQGTQLVRIVKLHGSLQDRVLPETFPEFFEPRPALKGPIRRTLNQDLLIVGGLELDIDIYKQFDQNHKQTSTYYVVEQPPVADDLILHLLDNRAQETEAFTIAGPYGAFASFFTTLEKLLSNKQSDTTRRSKGTTEQMVTLPIDQTRADQPLRADVLLVTVTETETQAVFETCKKRLKRQPQSYPIANNVYHDLGMINGARVFLLQTEMGAIGPGGSTLTIEEGIRMLHPSSIIMVGIAFGLRPDKQQLGTILVAHKIRLYDQQRVGTDPQNPAQEVIIPRGDRPSTSTFLINRFKSAQLSWKGARVETGLLFSGEKLVDNQALCARLRQIEPEALGGEMEGSGLYSVAQRYKINWMLVKAICDWGDGNKGNQHKEQDQLLAARNAAQFTLHTLQKMKFID